jgi:hypothetical protein
LQGSFLLLLIADKLQGEASPSVVKACETIVRAHEACVVTLNTEYQVRTSVSLTSDEFLTLTHLTEKFPQSHALSPRAGPWQILGRLWRTATAQARDARFVQMDWRWDRPRLVVTTTTNMNYTGTTVPRENALISVLELPRCLIPRRVSKV